MNFYAEDLICWTCHNTDSVEIPKGTTIEEYNDKCECRRCGCDRRLKKK